MYEQRGLISAAASAARLEPRPLPSTHMTEHEGAMQVGTASVFPAGASLGGASRGALAGGAEASAAGAGTASDSVFGAAMVVS